MSNTFKYKDKNISITCVGFSLDQVKDLLVTSRGDSSNTVYSDIKLQDNDTNYDNDKSSDVEEVNLNTIGRTVRMPKTTKDFKCPSCHQGIFININGCDEVIHVVRDIRGDIARLHAVDIESYGDFKGIGPVSLTKNKSEIIKVYVELLGIISAEELFITDDSSFKGHCPICDKINSLDLWIDAYIRPLDFNAESQNICEICGDSGDIEVTRNGDNISCKDRCIHKIII